jgi:hypothetical protein
MASIYERPIFFKGEKKWDNKDTLLEVCEERLGECVCKIKVRFTKHYFANKNEHAAVLSCFIVNGNELKKRQNCSWHDFATPQTNKRDFRIVLYCTI